MQLSLKKLFCIHVFIWLFVELFVNPIGEFPLNDDWAYYQNVYFLSEEGRFLFSDWLAMTLVLQVLWGALFCKIFGFSFTVLRIASLLLAVIGTWTGFLVFKRFTRHQLLAYGATLLLAFNPIYFSLANSFMTEIPFLSVFLPGLYCFVRYLDESEAKELTNKYWLGGMLFSLMATLIRQPGMILPLAFALVYLFRHIRNLGFRSIGIAASPFLVSLIVYKLYSVWLIATQMELPVYGEIGQLFYPFFNGSLPYKLITRNNDFLFYSGWFSLPLTLFLLKYYWTNNSYKQKGIAALLALGISSSFAWKFKLFPMGNMFGNFWLGPKTLFGERSLENIHGLVLSDTTWLSIKLIGMVAGVLLLFELALALFSHFAQKRWAILLCLTVAFGYYAFLILNPYYNDRYVLIFLPLLLILLFPSSEFDRSWDISKSIAVVIFAGLSYFSISGTHDYLSWNRTTWNIAHELEAQGVSPLRIHGGFEYSNWHKRPEFLPEQLNPTMDTSFYAISFESSICNWGVEKEYTYPHWLTLGEESIYLHKQEEKPSATKVFFCDSERYGNAKGDLMTSDTSILLSNRAPLDSAFSLSGKYSIRLDEKRRYSYNYTMDVVSPCHEITASVWRKRLAENKAAGHKYPSVLVISTDDINRHKTNVVDTRPGGWEKLECRLQLHNQTNAKEVKVYLWNRIGETQWFDDFKIEILTNE